jgi:hypothetical protein
MHLKITRFRVVHSSPAVSGIFYFLPRTRQLGKGRPRRPKVMFSPIFEFSVLPGFLVRGIVAPKRVVTTTMRAALSARRYIPFR